MKRNVCYYLLVLLTGLVVSCSTPSYDEQEDQISKAARLNVQLGMGYLTEGKLELADKKLKKALKQAPNLPTAQWAYALLQWRLGNDELAEKHFRKALSLDPDDSEARNNYGTFLCKKGRVEEAEQQFLQAVQNPLYAQRASAYENVGKCMLKVPNREKAEIYFRRALSINPRLPVALYQMGKMTFENGDYSASQDFLLQYHEIAEYSAQTLWLSYQVERHLGNRTAAKKIAVQLKNQFPRSKETSLLLIRERNGS